MLQLVCGVVLLAGCGDLEPTVRSVTRTDSAEIEIVHNTAVDRSLGWTFEKVLSLGGADSGVEAFYDVRSDGLAFDETGRIYILDSGNMRVLAFDESGRHVRTVGREGQGPGEFQYPSKLSVEPTGAIAVYDLGQRALLRFDTAGSFVGQVPISGSLYSPVEVHGPTLVFATRRRHPQTEAPAFEIHRVGPTDSTVLLSSPLTETRQVFYESCGLGVPLPPLFADPLAWDVRGRRIVFAESPNYSIRIFEDTIETRHVRRLIDARTATRQHAARELGEGEEWYVPRRGNCLVPAEEIINARGIASHIPAIEKVTISPAGYLWAQRDIIGENTGPIDVFDPAGEYLGTLPPGTPWPVDFGPGDLVLALEEGELGVQIAAVYRIGRG